MVKNNRGRQKSDLDELERMSDVAQMYYVDGLNEKEIGRALHCSAMHVSRILKRAREQHVVDIKINRQHTETIRQELMHQFGLVDVRITPRFSDDDESRMVLAKEAAQFFDQIVKEHISVGISGGRTIHKM